MTQLSEHEALVAAMADVQPYQTGTIARAGRPTQWTVCGETKHLMFFATREAAERACRIENMRAVLARIAAWMKEPTERMLSDGDSAIPRAEEEPDGSRMMGREVCVEAWRAMFDASPIVPGDGK